MVPDDQETLWWVFGLGENVRVHEPLLWAQTVLHRANKVKALYEQ